MEVCFGVCVCARVCLCKHTWNRTLPSELLHFLAFGFGFVFDFVAGLDI